MSLLAQPRLSLITRKADTELRRIQDILDHKLLVDGRSDVEEVLSRLVDLPGPCAPKTLDLIGHSTPTSSLLQLGDWVLDFASPTVTAFFRELAEYDVLPRLGVHAVRLLGCRTADTAHGRHTICVLSEILGLDVFGTTGLVFSAHYGASGFLDDWKFLLVGATELRTGIAGPKQQLLGTSDQRSLDIDTLPAVALAEEWPAWPRRIAGDRAARNLLRHVRRDEGAQMPGLLATPSCEVALRASTPGTYHLLQIIVDGRFVRVYPEGPSRMGVVYPVEQPEVLQSLIERLPAARLQVDAPDTDREVA